MEKGNGPGSRDIFRQQAPQSRSPHQAAGKRKQTAQGSADNPDAGVNASKKKDELGLTNRPKGAIYSSEQRQRIIEQVELLKTSGVHKMQP
jgi:hypothetical protein